MLPPDNHVHTEWSWDTSMNSTMERACEHALSIGLPAIAFTEHVDFTAWGDGDGVPGPPPLISHRNGVSPLDVAGYTANIERCRERFPELRIFSGIEAGEPHRFAGSVAAVLRSGTFERVLGSLHGIVHDGRLVAADTLYRTTPPDQVMRRYFTELLELVKGSDVFEVLAHADFPRRYWPPYAAPYDERDYEDEYRAVFRALAATDRVLEINTRSPLWSAGLVQWWYEEGGGAVSFGSDAHQTWRVGARFDVAAAVAESAGFRPGRHPLDFWRR